VTFFRLFRLFLQLCTNCYEIKLPCDLACHCRRKSVCSYAVTPVVPSRFPVSRFPVFVWNEHQSGKFTAEVTNLTKSGNRYLRYYLLEAADSLRRYDSEFRRFYDFKFKEVNRFQHT
jgi:hypothetical protein